MLTVFFTAQPPTDFKAVSTADHHRFARFFHKMLEQGVHLPPSGYEAWFLSLAHDETVIDQTVEAVRTSINVLT
jgi:glutamate-1-semialdehyde 2,1-aminomutase